MAMGIAALSVALGLVLSGGAGAVSPNPNPWLQNRFLNMAHQGGEDEAPSNTLFAFKSAIQDRGADTLELDVNLAKNTPGLDPKEELMVIHDDTYIRTTCSDALCPGPASAEPQRPASEVNDLTVGQLQALDAGYWFRPGTYSHNYSLQPSDYPYRGIATGAKPPPTGYAQNDFRIPTLREVLNEFPNTPINIEIKMIKTTTGTDQAGCVPSPTTYCDDAQASMPVADALADLLDEPQYASRTDIIVVSFSDALIDRFYSQDQPPEKVALAPATQDTIGYAVAGIKPSPDVAAFQVPPEEATFKVPEVLLAPYPPPPAPPHRPSAHTDGYAVHVWTNGDQDETDASYAHLYNLGVDGIMSSVPSRLAAFLCANGVPRPDGSLRGPGCVKPSTTTTLPETPAAAQTAKKCKKGQKLKRGKCVKKKRKHRRR